MPARVSLFLGGRISTLNFPYIANLTNLTHLNLNYNNISDNAAGRSEEATEPYASQRLWNGSQELT